MTEPSTDEREAAWRVFRDTQDAWLYPPTRLDREDRVKRTRRRLRRGSFIAGWDAALAAHPVQVTTGKWTCPECGSTTCPFTYCAFEDTASSAAAKAARIAS